MAQNQTSDSVLFKVTVSLGMEIMPAKNATTGKITPW
jgi:hypothetical protein